MQAQGRRTLPEATASTTTATVGTSYRFLVRSAEEAVGAIRKQLGDDARVVSVRAVKAGGVAGLLGGTRLEVIAQAPATAPIAVEAREKNDTMDAVSVVAQAAPAARRTAIPVATYAAAAAAAEPSAKAVAIAPTSEPSAASPVLPQQRLEPLLRRSGLSESLIARLQSTSGWPAAGDQPLHQGLTAVAGQIRQLAAGVVARPLPPRAAFMGLPGMGCTTALCKWLSSEVFKHGRHGTVASVEFDRPKGAEDLAVFCELLGVEFTRQAPVPEPTAAVNPNFSYFDVPALSLTRPEENSRLRAYLDGNLIPGRVLVVSGLLDSAVLRQACSAGMDVGCTHLVFTQLDELPQWGKLWDFLIEAPLAPLMASLGPSLSGECETDVVGAVLRRTFPWS
jgi:flagellar biosynthesis protein FlhF